MSGPERMLNSLRVLVGILTGMLIYSCSGDQIGNERHLPSKHYPVSSVPFASLLHRETVYVPIYSDIYHTSGEKRFQLTSTLSIRNTQPDDTLYVEQVDYYNSVGELVKEYLDDPIYILPMTSLEFVVETRDTSGAGASFLVFWGARKNIQPVIQGVMIGTSSQQGISFLTEGVTVESTDPLSTE